MGSGFNRWDSLGSPETYSGPRLRQWQQKALLAWEQKDHRGVVEAITGTGKEFRNGSHQRRRLAVANISIGHLSEIRRNSAVGGPSAHPCENVSNIYRSMLGALDFQGDSSRPVQRLRSSVGSTVKTLLAPFSVMITTSPKSVRRISSSSEAPFSIRD